MCHTLSQSKLVRAPNPEQPLHGKRSARKCERGQLLPTMKNPLPEDVPVRCARCSWPDTPRWGNLNGSPSTLYFAKLPRLKISSNSVQIQEAGSQRLTAIARRVCWWEPVASTLENTPQCFSAGSWRSGHGKTSALLSSIMVGTLFAKPCKMRLRVCSTLVPGIIGTTAWSFCLLYL